MRLGELGIANPVELASQEYEVSVTVTGTLTQRIIHQDHHTPDEADNNAAKSRAIAKKREALKESEVRVKSMLTPNSLKVEEQASERGASSWLTVIPLKALGYDLNKGEFRDALT